MLIKEGVVDEVTHSFWKKEYQSRGAQRYYILLDAPVIGVGPEHFVTAWVNKSISCQIPDERLAPSYTGLYQNTSFTSAPIIAGIRRSMRVLMLHTASLGFHKRWLMKLC